MANGVTIIKDGVIVTKCFSWNNDDIFVSVAGKKTDGGIAVRVSMQRPKVSQQITTLDYKAEDEMTAYDLASTYLHIDNYDEARLALDILQYFGSKEDNE